uniref:Uncharacterized protein n=1 Tax=Arundo donax TaxID=35708 RepID=A0A0A8XZB5_ARUDO
MNCTLDIHDIMKKKTFIQAEP